MTSTWADGTCPWRGYHQMPRTRRAMHVVAHRLRYRAVRWLLRYRLLGRSRRYFVLPSIRHGHAVWSMNRVTTPWMWHGWPLPDRQAQTLVAFWNRTACAIAGHDDALFHLARAGYADRPVCGHCMAPITRCNGSCRKYQTEARP